MKALVLAPFSEDALEALGRLMPVIYRSWHDSRKLHSPQELAEEIVEEQVQALVTEADFVFEEMFQEATCLRFLGVCRSSHSHVDLEAATRSGVAVAYTPHRNTVAVAELTLGLMLSLARGLPQLNCYVKAGRWQDPVEPYIEMRGQELAGRTLGVIGVGAIGGTVARLSRCFGMKVVGHDPFLAGSRRQRQRVPLVGLEELLEQSDLVSIHVSASANAETVLNAGHLAMMKPGSYLINTSAPWAVEESALLGAVGCGQAGRGRLGRTRHPSHPAQQPSITPRQGHPHSACGRGHGGDGATTFLDDGGRYPTLCSGPTASTVGKPGGMGAPCLNTCWDWTSAPVRCVVF